jgi:hypothetical protein
MDNASVTPDAAGLTVALTAHGSRILRVSPGDH